MYIKGIRGTCWDSRYTKIKAYWAMHCVLCLMSRLSIQEIKACHASMEQMLSYVETVDTQRSKHNEQCIVCCDSCRDCRYKRSKHVILQWFKCYVMSIQSIQNAYTCTHVSTHNFLNIQRIFNPKKVLECWESGLSNHTTKSYICRYCRYKSWYFNTIVYW